MKVTWAPSLFREVEPKEVAKYEKLVNYLPYCTRHTRHSAITKAGKSNPPPKKKMKYLIGEKGSAKTDELFCRLFFLPTIF